MAPPKGPKFQDLTVILFDLKAGPFSTTLDTLSTILLYKQLSAKPPRVANKLYLVNAGRTFNDYQCKSLCYIDHTVKLPVLLKEIVAISEQGLGSASWLDALDVAKEDLKPFAHNPGIVSLQIVFITDLDSFDPPTDQVYLNRLIRDLKNLDIYLYIVGPSVEPPKTLLTQNDVKNWMGNLNIDNYNKNLKIMERIVKETPHSVICSFENGVHLVNTFKYFKGVQPWYATLDFGTKLKVPTSLIRISKRGGPFKFKCTLRRRRLGWVYEDQQDTSVDFEDVVSGVLLHNKFVKVQNKERFKAEGPKSFRFLLFTASEHVPEYLMQAEGSYFVMADPRQKEYNSLFRILVEEMAAQGLYGIARKVYAARCNPKFYVLIPRTDLNRKGFTACELPYADDISQSYEEDSVTVAPKVDISENVSNFLDSIDISGDNCKINVPLAPKMMLYPSGLRIIDKVKQKWIEEFLVDKKSCVKLEEENPAFDVLKADWPVRKLEKAIKKKPENDFDDVDDFDFS